MRLTASNSEQRRRVDELLDEVTIIDIYCQIDFSSLSSDHNSIATAHGPVVHKS